MTLPKLNFPMSQFSVRKSNGKTEIFDIVRKKYVSLTPEEWVRQNVLHYLAETKRYPLELMQVEGSITFNSMPKRCDIIVYDKLLKPLLLVECKKPA
ncbi:MAG: type I restriction enzyme HsdR N-terminal domain-containing protein, partial [Bacteroidales bacterium]|nr:type I restriction enzyme HsdR N-terminal domain-containing protein [Bacteroidales bacterium]